MEFDGGHLLTRLFVICITYLVRHLLKSLAHLFVFLLLNFKGSLENSPLSGVYFANIFLPVCALYSHSLDRVFDREVFNFNKVLVINQLLKHHAFGVV